MTATPATKSLASKLAEVMLAVSRVPKRGRNEFHKYDYATESDITDAVRKELASRHLVMVPNVESIDRIELAPSKTGGERTLTVVHVTIIILDGESGERFEMKWAGAGEDGADKGLPKALTATVKYALMKLFLIPTGDDPEADANTDERAADATPRPRTPEPERVHRTGTGTISPAQQKRLFAIARESGWSPDEIKGFLHRRYGIEHSGEIQVANYDAIIDRLRAGLDGLGVGDEDAASTMAEPGNAIL